MITRDNITSYVGYVVPSAAISATADQTIIKSKTVDVDQATVNGTVEGMKWLHSYFPEAVEQGIIVVKNGEIFLYGLNLLTCISILAIVMTLGFTVIKFVIDSVVASRQLKQIKKSEKPLCDCGKFDVVQNANES